MLSYSLACAPEVRITVSHSVDNRCDHGPVTLRLPIHIDRICSMSTEYSRSFAWHKCSSKKLNNYANHVNELLACLGRPG